jgi:hypothetical protein
MAIERNYWMSKREVEDETLYTFDPKELARELKAAVDAIKPFAVVNPECGLSYSESHPDGDFAIASDKETLDERRHKVAMDGDAGKLKRAHAVFDATKSPNRVAAYDLLHHDQNGKLFPKSVRKCLKKLGIAPDDGAIPTAQPNNPAAEHLLKHLKETTPKAKFMRAYKAGLEGEHGNAGALFANPAAKGIRYDEAHPNGTPKNLNDPFDARAELKLADGDAAKLLKMSGLYDGSDPDSAKAYSAVHHSSSGAQAVYKTAVDAIAKKLDISGSDESNTGVIPTKQETQDADMVLLGHIVTHLQEFKELDAPVGLNES